MALTSLHESGVKQQCLSTSCVTEIIFIFLDSLGSEMLYAAVYVKSACRWLINTDICMNLQKSEIIHSMFSQTYSVHFFVGCICTFCEKLGPAYQEMGLSFSVSVQ